MNTTTTMEEFIKERSLKNVTDTYKLLNWKLKEVPCLLLYEKLDPNKEPVDSLAKELDFLPQDVIIIPVKSLEETDVLNLFTKSLEENQYRFPAIIFPSIRWNDPNLLNKLQNTQGVLAKVTEFTEGKLWFPITGATRLIKSGGVVGIPKECIVNIIPGTFIFDVTHIPEGLINPVDQNIEMKINNATIKITIYDGHLLGYPQYFKTLDEK